MKPQKAFLFIFPAHPLCPRLPAPRFFPLSLFYALRYTLLRFLGGASPGISALTRSTWVARLWLTWSFASGNITARRFADRRRSLVAATVGGTHCQRTFNKKREREREREISGAFMFLHKVGSSRLWRALLFRLPRSLHTATKILPVLVGMRWWFKLALASPIVVVFFFSFSFHDTQRYAAGSREYPDRVTSACKSFAVPYQLFLIPVWWPTTMSDLSLLYDRPDLLGVTL